MLAVSIGGAGRRQIETSVDLELVLAVDVSLSMDMDEQRLQRDGYVAAFRDAEVWNAIAAGADGRIAVTYFEWAGQVNQQTVLPWTLIDGAADSADLCRSARGRADFQGAHDLHFGRAYPFGRQLEASPFKGTRRVVDVSGDGPNNSGAPAQDGARRAHRKGIIINGLPILLKRDQPSGFFDISNLDTYYTNCVIGGAGAFMIPVRDRAEFRSATRRKLILEISNVVPVQPARLVHTQASSGERIDCMVGERMWRLYMDGSRQ